MMKTQRSAIRALYCLSLLTGTLWLTAAPSHATTFVPPAGNAAPRQATGGASRGGFVPPAGNAAPRQATGGASRGEFVPPSSNAAPSQATGGASRGSFTPPPASGTPSQATGGASRGEFTPPPANGTPTEAQGGASRTNLYGSYVVGDQLVSMLALLPNSFYGTTLDSHPTILVYVPASDAREAVFSIKDEAKNLRYQMIIPITGQAGIMAIQLPANAPALEIDKNYQWYVALKLEGHLSVSSPFVDGWIKRIAPSATLTQALAQKSPLQRSTILAANGVWYDSAAILATLRMAQPTDTVIAKEWQELLNSVQLSQLTNLPFESASK